MEFQMMKTDIINNKGKFIIESFLKVEQINKNMYTSPALQSVWALQAVWQVDSSVEKDDSILHNLKKSL